MKIAITVVAFLFIYGCVSTGTRVSESALGQFHKGETTEADVTRALGPPTTTSNFSGTRYVTYSGVHAQPTAASFIPIVGAFAGGASVQQSVVTFIFGADGKLVDFSSTQSNIGSRSGVNVQPEAQAPSPTTVK